jgi:hypothetical protein
MALMSKISRRAQRLVRSVEYAHIDPTADAAVGSAGWFVGAEIRYGGHVTNVVRRAVSAADPRSSLALSLGGMTGGDRMFHHGYSVQYAEHLRSFVARRFDPLVIVEVGILRGSGLAVWSELFPNAEVIGLDIDLSHFHENLPNLKMRGAFACGEPELHIFDQFLDGDLRMEQILGDRSIDIFVDDGYHSNETILNTFRAAKPLLSEEFVYFVEDNDDVANALANEHPDNLVLRYGEMTVVKRRQPV